MSSVHISNIYDDDCFRLRDNFYLTIYRLDAIIIKNNKEQILFNLQDLRTRYFNSIDEKVFVNCIRKWINENSSFFILNSDDNTIGLTDSGRQGIFKMFEDHFMLDNVAESLDQRNVQLSLSNSVAATVNSLDSNLKIDSFDLVRLLLDKHPEYAKTESKTILKSDRPNLKLEEKTREEWLNEINSLYNKNIVKFIHGRIFILGICLIDKNIGKYLSNSGFMDSLLEEIEERPVNVLFTEKGQYLFDIFFLGNDVRTVNDNIPISGDIPIENKEFDLLERWPFVKAICNRLMRIHEIEKGSFLIHLYGPWGSGKSSVLKLVKNELKQETPRWIVIEFNAWEHQNIGPPWWSLIDAVYKQGSDQLSKISFSRSAWIVLTEKLWRIRVGHSLYFWIPTVFFAILGIAFLQQSDIIPNIIGIETQETNINSNPTSDSWNNLVASVGNVGGILSLIVSIFSGVQALKNSLVSGSEHAAKEFAERSNDPTRKLREHFKKLIENLNQPVIILIDDLDRCNNKYAVEFLEGIQTLFRDANVFYIIAADRNWLYTSFEKSYDSFKESIGQTGLPFGELFLSKIFQMSVSIPPMNHLVQREYFTQLLNLSQTDTTNQIEKARTVAKEKINNLNSEDEILAEIKKTTDPIENKALREEAITRLSSTEVEKKTEHLLLPFSHLIEPNPRAIKRLLNSYGILRDIDLLRGEGADIVGRKELALWTILNYRWPSVATYFENNPKMIDVIRKNRNLEELILPKELKELPIFPEIRKVIEGRGIEGTFLDEDTVRKITGNLKDE